MNSTQIIITSLYGTTVVVAILISVFVIRSTGERRRRRPGIDTETLTHRENSYALWVTGALLALLASTIFVIPYGEDTPEDAQEVQVDSFQYGWSVEPATVRANEPVVFVLRSRDVQHGFGLYDDTKLLGQAQVQAPKPGDPPDSGLVQRFQYEFDEPGTYEINCLEFCGVGHHLMVGEIEVVE